MHIIRSMYVFTAHEGSTVHIDEAINALMSCGQGTFDKALLGGIV